MTTMNTARLDLESARSTFAVLECLERQALAHNAGRMAADPKMQAWLRGEGREPLATASVEVIWQTAKNLIRYLELDGQGRASFFVGSGDGGALTEGNALVGAYDADGRLIWSWHLWVHRCCTTVRLRWQRSTMSILRSFRALPAIRVPKSRRVLTWKN